MSMHVVRMTAPEVGDLLDVPAMTAMREAVGHELFDDIFEDAVFEITERLSRIEILMDENDLPRVARIAHDLVAVAGTIGLVSLSEVAANLEFCCEDQDPIAAQAVGRRLLRVGEESLVRAAQCRAAGG